MLSAVLSGTLAPNSTFVILQERDTSTVQHALLRFLVDEGSALYYDPTELAKLTKPGEPSEAPPIPQARPAHNTRASQQQPMSRPKPMDPSMSMGSLGGPQMAGHNLHQQPRRHTPNPGQQVPNFPSYPGQGGQGGRPGPGPSPGSYPGGPVGMMAPPGYGGPQHQQSQQYFDSMRMMGNAGMGGGMGGMAQGGMGQGGMGGMAQSGMGGMAQGGMGGMAHGGMGGMVPPHPGHQPNAPMAAMPRSVSHGQSIPGMGGMGNMGGMGQMGGGMPGNMGMHGVPADMSGLGGMMGSPGMMPGAPGYPNMR